jgi:hypothetical protein
MMDSLFGVLGELAGRSWSSIALRNDGAFTRGSRIRLNPLLYLQAGPSPLLPSWLEFGISPARADVLMGFK